MGDTPANRLKLFNIPSSSMLFFLLIFSFKISPILTTMTFRNIVFESKESTSGNGSILNDSNNTSDSLIEGYMSSGYDSSCLSSTATKQLNNLNSISENGHGKGKGIDDTYLEDIRVLTSEEVGIKRELKRFLTDLKYPSDHNLNEALWVYKIQTNPSLKIKNSHDIFEYTIKAMILSLQLNEPQVFLKLISYFELKIEEIRDFRHENIFKLFDFIILALFKQETKISTFISVFNNFLDFLTLLKENPIEEEIKKFLEYSGNEQKNGQIFEKIIFFIELILKKIYILPIEPFDKTGQSFLSIYFKCLCRTGKSIEASNFLIEIPRRFLVESKLSIEDSFNMLLVATEYNSVEMFNEILKVANSDFSFIFSSEFILKRMKNSLIQFTPKLSEIRLNPHKFTIKTTCVTVILDIFLSKASFEEIIAYFIEKGLFLQLELLLPTPTPTPTQVSLNHEQITKYLKSLSFLSSEADYLKLIFLSLPFYHFYLLISEILKFNLLTDDLNLLALRALSNLPGNLLTSWAIHSIVSLSPGGPEDLLILALKSYSKDVIELLCAFYKFEGNAELLKDFDASERRIVFINVDGFELVQIFDQFNNSFELYLP